MRKFIFLVLCICCYTTGLHADENAIVSLQETGKAFASIAKAVSPAVVNIQSDQTAGEDEQYDDEYLDDESQIPPPLLDLLRPQRRQPILRQGSGFIITKDGYIVTNNHLVKNASKITVRLLDKKEYVAKIVGVDPQSDVAVIKIDATNLPTVVLGNSDTAQVGEWVVALGNPFGLSHSLSAGILSAKGRSSVGITDYENFLQTDAAINPGNSGGPLLDLEGKVIGINTAIFSRSGGYMGIGFAIPINMAKNIIDQLIAKGSVVRGFLGVKIQELTKDLADSFDLAERKGILISQVETGSPADKGGLKQGDIVTGLDGVPVDTIGDFRNSIASNAPGSKHTLDILRDKKPMQLQVAIGNLSTDNPSKDLKPEEQQAISKIGISVQNLTSDIAAKLGLKTDTGVIISKVKSGSIGEFAGLTKGALILEVNRKKVDNVKQFMDELAKVSKNNTVMFLVQDPYGSRYIVINLG